MRGSVNLENSRVAMIGIDPQNGQCRLAMFRGTRPEVLGMVQSFHDLTGMIGENAAAILEEQLAVIAVPVWYNDGQRKEILDEAKTAGIKNARLINRPAAAAYAYSALKPSDRSKVVVLEIENESFDVSVLVLTGLGFEIVASDGLVDLKSINTMTSSTLSGLVEMPVRRALETAGFSARDIDEFICIGQTDLLACAKSDLFMAFGHELSTRIDPEEAVAIGAAVYGRLIEMGL